MNSIGVAGDLKRRKFQQITGYLSGLAAGICYGTWSVIAKSGMGSYDIPPLMLAATAFVFGTFMFTPALANGLLGAIRASKRSVAFFGLSGISSGVAIVALSFGLENGDVSVVTPIVSISPLITVVLARIFLEHLERVSITVVLGVLLVVGGTALVVVGDSVF